MGFSAEWLDLREPVDHRSVNPEVRAALQQRFGAAASISVVDLGCGSGSNLRGTHGCLPPHQNWTLVDYDPALLAAARERLVKWADRATEDRNSLRLGKAGHDLAVRFKEADLSAGFSKVLAEKPDLVTAAALFDLVSVNSIEALADAVVQQGAAFYTVLTYDGFAHWQPPHPADATIRDAFNAHQRSDKGFGPAAGPGGTSALARAFYSRGYRVLRGTSPWQVDGANDVMRGDLDKGFANAARETGRVDQGTIKSWLDHRLGGTGRLSTIGHEDLLALPA